VKQCAQFLSESAASEAVQVKVDGMVNTSKQKVHNAMDQL